MACSDKVGEFAPEHGTKWLARQRLPGEALICGSSPSLLEDFKLAHQCMPEAVVVAVNESASVVDADFLITQHPEKAERFRQLSKNPEVVVHTGKPRERASQRGIDVYWPDGVTLATSGGSAIKIALEMGFERIVLCGMPMNGGDGYFAQSALEQDEPRFGFEDPESEYIDGYRKALVRFVEENPEARRKVRSLGGFTRELFGAPGWAE